MARTIEFNRADVLKKAMEIFWQEGYCKTSISNLVIATKLKPGSLYAAFNSKEGLFLAALDCYGESSLQQLNQSIIDARSPLQGVKNFISKIFHEMQSKDNKGCLLVNTLLETSANDTAINERVNGHLNAIELALTVALTTAKKNGELAVDKNPNILAKFTMVNIWGIQVLSKRFPDKATVIAIEKQLLLIFER